MQMQVQGLRDTAEKKRRVQSPHQEEYGTVFLFDYLENSPFSLGTGARQVKYSGEGEISTASVPRGVRDRVSVCFSGKNSVFSSAGTGAWLEDHSYEQQTSTASAPVGVRDCVFVCFSINITVFYSAGTSAWLEEYSGEGEMGTTSAPEVVRDRVSTFIYMSFEMIRVWFTACSVNKYSCFFRLMHARNVGMHETAQIRNQSRITYVPLRQVMEGAS
jgi:hypothetical protein